LNFKDKKYWALILGGSSGMGMATAKKIASKGMNICIVHRDIRSRMSEAEKSFEEIRSMGVELLTFNVDASSEQNAVEILTALQETMKESKVKLLLHAVSKGNLKSILPKKPKPNLPTANKNEIEKKFDEINSLIEEHQADVGELTETDINITHQAMCTSIIHWCKHLVANDQFAEGARVVALTSEGNKRIWHSYVAIAIAKSSIETLIKYLAKELAPYGVTANIIQAGITDTPSLRMIPGNEMIRASTINRNPFGRLTKAEDIANFIYLLCLDEAAWVNGAIIPVDGGEHFC